MQRHQQILFWLVALLLLVATIGLLKDILLPFVAGMAIAYFLNPLAERLTRLGMKRVWASALLVAVGGVIVVATLVFLVPLVVNQAQQLMMTAPTEVERIREALEGWARARLGARFPAFEAGLARAMSGLADNWTALAGAVAKSVFDRGMAVFNFASLLLVTPLVVFYLLVDWHPMMAKVDEWLPRQHADTIRALGNDINSAVSAFIRGQGTVCLALGAFYAIGLSVVGLKYGLLVGLATGILAFVPFVGWALGLITALVMAVLQFWPDATPLLMVAAVFLGGQALDAGFLSPSIVGSKIGLHPVWLIFALFVFSYLFGFVGMLVAVPVAAAIGVLVRYGLKVYLASPVYHGHDAPEAAASARAAPPVAPPVVQSAVMSTAAASKASAAGKPQPRGRS